MGKKRGAWLLASLSLLMPMALTASSGFNESQLVVQPGHLEVGCGQFFLPGIYRPDTMISYEGRYLMDVWFKTGVAPGMDAGVSFDPMGARLDAYLKHRLYKDYLSLSYEFQSGLWINTIGRDFALQLSLLAGYPGKLLAPYGIMRQRLFFLGVNGIETGSALLLVAGLKINLLKVSSLYLEAGTCMGKYSATPSGIAETDVFTFPVLGAGASIDFDLKEIFAPLQKGSRKGE